jgi:hypothetical protein
MHITVRRTFMSDTTTTGELYINGSYFCHTLEDVVRLDNPATPQNEGLKIWGKTAIPAGIYKIIVNLSPRFKKFMPRLVDVPGFDGILIHGGNTAEDTNGCILVGYTLNDNHDIAPGTSRIAYDALFQKIEQAIKVGEQVTIELTNEFDHA